MPINPPVLAQSDLQVLKSPSTPADPPTPAHRSKACLFLHDISGRATHPLDSPLTTGDDICNAATYTSQVIATRIEPHPGLEAALVNALNRVMPDLLRPIHEIQLGIAELRKELRGNRRLLALTWNSNSRPTAMETFEIVPFANFEDPTTPPHNLPALVSPVVINGLLRPQYSAYIRGYYPDLEVPEDEAECLKWIFTAIGAYNHAS